MPIIECGFPDANGHCNPEDLAAYGPTCRVSVSFLEYADGLFTATGQSRESFALVDSGATMSCIDEELARELGLPVVDVQRMAGVGGVQEHNVYLGMVSITDLRFQQYGQFAGVDMSAQVHKVLLGRTFLQNVIMIYDGIRGTVTVASAA